MAVRRLFNKYPLVANSVVYGALYTSAEFSQQTLTRKFMVQKDSSRQDYDAPALVRFAVYGTTIQSNILYFWYKWLDSRFIGTGMAVVTKKILLDQFLLTPPLTAAFYVCMSAMEGKSDVLEECHNKFIPTFKTSCMFWLPAQMINFLWVPPAGRVIYVGTCALIWVNILCWYKRQSYPGNNA